MSKNKLWQIFVSVFSLNILIITANSQETYSQNFDDFDNGETDLGDGSVIFGQAASIQDVDDLCDAIRKMEVMLGDGIKIVYDTEKPIAKKLRKVTNTVE